MAYPVDMYTDKKVDNLDHLKRSLPLDEYYQTVLDAFETERYTAEGAWAHTEPARKVVCILPREFRDYNLPIEKHEILHNAFPDAPEAFIRSAAFNPSYDSAARKFRLAYH